MSPALIQLFAFMTCTFALGLFVGWSLWRYGGISKAAMEDLESKVEFLKKSLEQSRLEVWNLQEGKDAQPDKIERKSRPSSRRLSSKTPPAADSPPKAATAQPAQS